MWKPVVASVLIVSAAALLTFRLAGLDLAGGPFIQREKERRLTITGTRAPFYLRALIAEKAEKR
jgi:hypothetical protein